MDEIYRLLYEAQQLLSQRNAYTLNNSKEALYPYQKADIDFFIENMPLGEEDHKGIAFINQLLTIRDQLSEDHKVIDADILIILFDFEADLTKFLLLAFAEEKIDFSNVLYLYIVQKIKPILRSTISQVELVNLHWLVESHSLDGIIIPPSFVEKYKIQLDSGEPGIVYWFTRFLFLKDYEKELRPQLEENRRSHFDWRIRAYSAQCLGKVDQLSLADQLLLKNKPNFLDSLPYTVAVNSLP